jgi:hypothetical protein
MAGNVAEIVVDVAAYPGGGLNSMTGRGGSWAVTNIQIWESYGVLATSAKGVRCARSVKASGQQR